MQSTFSLYSSWSMLPELALEAHDLLRGQHGGEIPGVSLTEEQEDLATVHRVTILNQQGSALMQKPMGTYITIFSQELTVNQKSVQHRLSALVARYLRPFVEAHITGDQDQVLVVGLGNWRSTPDALGPRTVQQLMATRHLFGRVPQALLDGVQPLATIAPGVLGMTGLESADLLRGIVAQMQPRLMLVIDALAAGDSQRIGTTIQLCDTGLSPGGGLGNQRAAINEATMGVPVISIGIPTVVRARIIAHQVLEDFWNGLCSHPELHRPLMQLPEPVGHHLMEQALAQCQAGLDVTPKEIDDLMTNGSRLLANAITQAIHPDMNEAFADSFF